MVHQYQLNGYNIVLDTCSGAIHVVDEVAYDIIALYPDRTADEIVSAMKMCIRDRLKTMLPVGSALFVKLAFSAAKKYPGECKTARMDIDRRMTCVICDWRDKK